MIVTSLAPNPSSPDPFLIMLPIPADDETSPAIKVFDTPSKTRRLAFGSILTTNNNSPEVLALFILVMLLFTVIGPIHILLPLTLHKAPLVPLLPLPERLSVSFIMIPLSNSRVAKSSTTTPPAAVPKADEFCMFKIPALTVVTPL